MPSISVLFRCTLFPLTMFSLSSAQLFNVDTQGISAAPAILPEPPISPYTGSPPEGSVWPVIPSTSAQNPDLVQPINPDTVAAPMVSLDDDSSAAASFCQVQSVHGWCCWLLLLWGICFMV